MSWEEQYAKAIAEYAAPRAVIIEKEDAYGITYKEAPEVPHMKQCAVKEVHGMPIENIELSSVFDSLYDAQSIKESIVVFYTCKCGKLQKQRAFVPYETLGSIIGYITQK